MRIYKEFVFEAAHFMPGAPADSPYRRIHGHSYRVRVTLQGSPDETSGLIVPFHDIEAVLNGVRGELDHRFLNDDVEGLDNPTMERMAEWLWGRLHNELAGLAEIAIFRDTCREGCVYSGPSGSGG
jgi:6-pyruvoyltetrahydropterin/6-carboxytetrahydropterin synthase